MAILRPLKGLDADLERNLESSFLQDYNNYEIIFSLASRDDPAYALVESLRQKYPEVKARLVIGINEFIVGLASVGPNPKVNNLIKGYSETSADIIWILDSNVRTEPQVLRRAVAIFNNPKIGLVHHIPCGVKLSTLGAYLDGSFLNCTHARMYTVINQAGIASCIIGKSNLFRKADLERIGGLSQFGKYISEDNMIGKAIMGLGLQHQIAPDVVYQTMGSVSISNFIQRRTRWIRVRKYAVTVATLYEPFSECLICGILASYAFRHYYGSDIYLFNMCHWILWFTSDMLVAKSSYGSRLDEPWSDFPMFCFGWLVLQFITLPTYIFAMIGTEITWRNERFLLNSDGTTMLIKKTE